MTGDGLIRTGEIWLGREPRCRLTCRSAFCVSHMEMQFSTWRKRIGSPPTLAMYPFELAVRMQMPLATRDQNSPGHRAIRLVSM